MTPTLTALAEQLERLRLELEENRLDGKDDPAWMAETVEPAIREAAAALREAARQQQLYENAQCVTCERDLAGGDEPRDVPEAERCENCGGSPSTTDCPATGFACEMRPGGPPLAVPAGATTSEQGATESAQELSSLVSTLRAEVAQLREERDMERSRFSHHADKFGDLAFELDRKASSDWGHLRHFVLASVREAVKNFRSYAAGQPSPSNWRRRAEAAEADASRLRGALKTLTEKWRNEAEQRKQPSSSSAEHRTRCAPMRIAVVGSRDYPMLDAVRQFIFECEGTTVIVSGGARGVDSVAVNEAKRRHMPYEEHLPDWNRYGKRAGAVRNREIVSRADLVVAFWDEQSKGTEITMRMALDLGRPLRVFGRNGLPLTYPARLTDSEEGKAIGSATRSSLSLPSGEPAPSQEPKA